MSNRLMINGRFLTQRVTGVQRYAHEVLLALDGLLSNRGDIEIEILAPREALDIPSYKKLKVRKVGRLGGQAWEQVELPFYARGRVLFTPCGAAPVAHPRNVWTIHDAAVFSTPNAYSFHYRTWYQVITRALSRTCMHMLTVSEFSRAELIRHCDIPKSRISVIYPGSGQLLKHKADVSVLQKHGLRESRYVLAVSSLHANKNFAGFLGALKALGDLDVQFAIAGSVNGKIFRRDFEIPSYVRQLGYVSDAELRALYENAACFVFPSFYEGFGFPPLEAMSLGCPVVAARAASLPEVLEDHARFCDPSDPMDIAAQIREALSRREDKDSLMGHAARFDYGESAARTWAVLESCLAA